MHRITDKGDIRVQYEGCNNRWTFHPGALTKVTAKEAFSLGDIVRVKSDLAAVKQYQRGHGEWIDVMKNVSPIAFFTFLYTFKLVLQLCKNIVNTHRYEILIICLLYRLWEKPGK